MTETLTAPESLATTPLHALHVARGGRMVAFAGYALPLHYGEGIVAEHAHVRTAAGLFDVSHMGQAFLAGPDHDTLAGALETLAPADLIALQRGRMRYTQWLDERGGILDDLMVIRSADPAEDGVLMVVVNAARKEADYAYLRAVLPATVKLLRADHRALIALQGPFAATVLARHCGATAALTFMSAISTRFDGIECHISRSGYTGEDGFEISVKAVRVRAIVERLLAEPEVKLVGLGARDSLRLEAGLCLYGNDIDADTSPIEAGLTWSIGARRRREGGFAGATRGLAELANGPSRRRVGLAIEGRIPARAGAPLFSTAEKPIGKVTSGGFAVTLGHPIAMGYVEEAASTPGTEVRAVVRGKELAARVVALPFVPHHYYRGP